jgi:hypothetical protein
MLTLNSLFQIVSVQVLYFILEAVWEYMRVHVPALIFGGEALMLCLQVGSWYLSTEGLSAHCLISLEDLCGNAVRSLWWTGLVTKK